MDRSANARRFLELLLPAWRLLLQRWALEGAISRAASEALGLNGEPLLLQRLVGQWAAGDFSALPPIVLLPASAMPGAAGAYALSTGTIYLNADWLQSASQQQALAVLSEELGHHLDGLLNASDTPGDEGELFAALLQPGRVSSEAERRALQAENDRGVVLVAGRELEVEQAAVVTSTPIRVTYPGKTAGEFRNLYAFAALKSDGSVVTWGDSSHGGNSSGVASQLGSGVVAFANPFTDDRLVFDVLLPSITLAVSPASVTEDGTANLAYTFTRSGSTTNSLTVNYSVGGSATRGVDYTGITGSGYFSSTYAVTFAAGSATATVTVDPTADTEVEADETVALTLAAGSGYTIGTTAAVVGTITNDDVAIPSITLAVFPAAVTEDGTANLVYTLVIRYEGSPPRPGGQGCHRVP